MIKKTNQTGKRTCGFNCAFPAKTTEDHVTPRATHLFSSVQCSSGTPSQVKVKVLMLISIMRFPLNLLSPPMQEYHDYIQVKGPTSLTCTVIVHDKELTMIVAVKKRALIIQAVTERVNISDHEGNLLMGFVLDGFILVLENQCFGVSVTGKIKTIGEVYVGKGVLVENVGEDWAGHVVREQLEVVKGHLIIEGFTLVVRNVLLVMEGKVTVVRGF